MVPRPPSLPGRLVSAVHKAPQGYQNLDSNQHSRQDLNQSQHEDPNELFDIFTRTNTTLRNDIAPKHTVQQNWMLETTSQLGK